METAVDPELINWENLGLTKGARCFRITFATIISILLLLATTLLILYVKVQETELKQDAISCATDTEITEAAALADTKLPEDQQSNKMYCYCRSIFWEKINDNESPYSDMRYEFEDGEMHCWSWFQDYSLSKTLLYAVPFSIIVVNFISKTILRLMTSYYGYQSKPEEVYASAVNMFWMSFINTGLVI